MLAQLRFGVRRGELAVPDDKLLGHFQGPVGKTDLEPQALVRSALAEPIEAPQLHRACTPDDAVAIVLDPGTPRVADLLVPVLETFTQQAGILPKQISIIYPAGSDGGNVDRFIEDLPEELADVQLVEHRPDDSRSMAYLASTESGQRVYLNRVVVDADIVFVLGRSEFDAATGRRGLSSALYPALSNSEALALVRRTATESRRAPEALYTRQHCKEVAHLTGLYYGMAVALDAQGSIERCWLGRFDAVEQVSANYADENWVIEPPALSPDLVVAVCSATAPADWSTAGKALESASRITGVEGSQIVLVSDLAAALGPLGQHLRDGQTPWTVVSRARASNEIDSVATYQCASTLAAYKVYMLSTLSDELVESMGFTPVGSLHEIENLIECVDTVYLLESADRVHVAQKQRQ